MPTVGQKEKATQNRIIELFKTTLDYNYLGDWTDRTENKNIEETLLKSFLKTRGYSDILIKRAIFSLKQVANDQSRSLYDVNRSVYDLLRYGVKVQEEAGENFQTVWLVDWKEPCNNDFSVAEEVTVKGQNTKRPDIVIYVNGIALGVIELKRSVVSVSEGIRQNLDNQKKIFIQQFFATQQIIMAGNDTEGLKYGTIETKEKYYLTWKEPSEVINLLDRHVLQMCEKNRFLEIIHDFIVYDAGIKKLPRQNQYFGVRSAQKSIEKRQGGIIWHTQGSGKSLTMVWLTKWIKENIKNSRVLVITDRTELDEQIEKVFSGVNEAIYRAESGSDLLSKINDTLPWLLCSLVHKFGNKSADDENADVDTYLAELKYSMPKDFLPKGNLFVFVDECHRTQSGKLHDAMKAILPDAMFIGFTGTPLLKSDKQTSLEVFGPFIHTYKFDEAVKDGVVLDLRYEARDVDQNLTSPEKIDKWFEAKTSGLNDIAKAQLKARWGTLQKVLSSQSRLEKIVSDILMDMETKDRLKSGRGNAMLVSSSIYQACKFYELLEKTDLGGKCAIVTSYRPSPNDIKGDDSGEGLTEKLRKYEIYNKMLGEKDPEAFEKEVKRKFIDEPGQMKLLIVVNKLLTGFDAPSATYLYLDQEMRDHSLFQAICRVNRLDGDDKEYGYIIDYKDLFKSLQTSIKDYTSGALDGYVKEDVAGLLTDRLEKARERLEYAREAVKALCEEVEPPKDSAAYLTYFCAKDTADKNALKENEPKRLTLYKLASELLRAYADIANEMTLAGYTTEEIGTIKFEVDYFEKVRNEVKLASGDYIDLKMYEPAMRHLIDSYIRAEESEVISAFDDMSLVQLIVDRGEAAINELPKGILESETAVAETIENNVRKLIIDESPVNPKYYEKMSELLDALIEQRRSEAIEYQEYLKKIIELTGSVASSNVSKTYPKGIKSNAQKALYDNLGSDLDLAIKIDSEIRFTKKDDWRGNKFKEKEIKNAISKFVSDANLAEAIFEIVKNQHEY